MPLDADISTNGFLLFLLFVDADISWEVTSTISNTTSNLSAAVETVTYKALLPGNTTLTQLYSFHPQPQPAHFAGINFTLGAGSLKWSINLNKTSSSSSSATNGALQFSFVISAGTSTNGSPATPTNQAAQKVTRFENEPQANMTTYWISVVNSGSSTQETSAIEVQVFDIAIVDGDKNLAVNHSIEPYVTSNNSITYELVLTMPPYQVSLEYDPVVGLGLLVASGSGGVSGGGTDTGLIIAVSVVVPVAVVVVVGTTAVGAVALYLKRRRSKRRLTKRMSRISMEYQL